MKTQLDVEIPVVDLDAQDVALTFFTEVWNERGEVAWSGRSERVTGHGRVRTRLRVLVEETPTDSPRVTVCWSGVGYRRDAATGTRRRVHVAGIDTFRLCDGRLVAGRRTRTFS